MRPTEQREIGERSIDRIPEPAELATAPSSVATLPSMKSKMLATTITPPAEAIGWDSSQPATMLISRR